MGKSNKVLKDTKDKQKQPKIVDSITCSKCKEQCADYIKYEELLASGKMGKGVVCRRGV